MNILRILSRLSIIAMLPLAIPAPAHAAPLHSPLAVTPDALGAELQQTFISAPHDIATKTANSFIAYRKTVDLGTVPKNATLHVFADVRYVLWLNGQPVHRGPSRFDTRGPQYDSVDVTSALRSGANTFAIVVMGNASNSRMMKHEPGLTLRLDTDGRPLLKTDETWKWSDQTRYRPAKVNWAHIIDRIDSRVEDGDWTLPDYNDRAWKSVVKLNGDSWGPLAARRIPLLRDTPVVAKLADNATFPIALAAGQQLKFSMGRLVQAYTMLTFEADEGTQLTLNYADIDYIARPGQQIYISSDSYAFDGGAITVKSGKVKITNLKLVERLYPFDRVGSFKSNDALLNRLADLCARSLQILSEDAYVDCADRERAEWMDCDPPDFDVTRTTMSAPGPDGRPIYADARLLGELLRRTALSQQKDGWVKAHTASDRFDIHARMEDRSCDWVEGARRYYESTGDPALIREIWPAVVRQMNYFLIRRSSRGLVIGRDWVMWFNPMEYETGEAAGLNAFVYKALVDAAFLGTEIGQTEDANKFDHAAKELAVAFNKVLWNEEEGTYYSGYDTDLSELPPGTVKGKIGVMPDWNLPPKPPTLPNNLIAATSYPALIALDQEIVPAARRERVKKYLFAHPDPRPRIMYFYYYWKQLYAEDQPELDQQILDAMRQKWKDMVNFPWQTSFEEFDVGSKAHCYGMFPGYFLSAYVLGVRPELPASSKRLLIEPRLGDLISAEGVVVTEYGPVPVSWKLENGKLHFRVEVPAGITATLRVPKLGAGGKLTFTGKPGPISEQGRYWVSSLGAGRHEGIISP